MKNELLAEMYARWKKTLRERGMTIKEFCLLAEIPRNTFYSLKNPTYNLITKIETNMQLIEKEQ